MHSKKFKYILRVIYLWIFIQSFATLAGNTTITILETSDLHGFIHNWDYFSGQSYDQGLAMVQTIVKSEKITDPDLLLLDGGDTNQGTPLAYYYNIKAADYPNPMVVAMNAMEYDAMTIGNHDYNYGQDVLTKFIDEANFPVMSANIRKESGEEMYKPYLIKTIKGVDIGILSLTTTGIPIWEKPEYISGLRFDDAVKTAIKYVPEMIENGADVLIALVHSGTHIEPENSRDAAGWMTPYHTWQDKGYADVPDQNFVIKLAEEVPELDAILSGHAHSTIPQAFINGVLVVEPSHWGRGVSKVLITVDDNGNVVDKKGEFLSVRGLTPDDEILELTSEYHETAVNYVNLSIANATGDFQGGDMARVKDGPLIDMINTIQLDMAANAGFPAQISLAAIFNNRGRILEGPVTIADIYGIYQYDNTLYVMEITGDILKRALEHDSKYWSDIQTVEDLNEINDLKSGATRDYNWDMYSGIDYSIDLTKPVGLRVTKLNFNGVPVDPDQKLVLAINNYRAGGGGGDTMFKEGKVLWKSMSVIRDYMVDYIMSKDQLNPEDFYEHNWDIYPEYLQKLEN